MIKDRETTVGYHCPNCGMSILNRVNIFMMDGNIIRIKCVCGGSDLVLQSLRNNKFRLTVPCILCPNSHSFTLSSGVMFQKELFGFTCKFTAINICYIGSSNQVFEAMKQNEAELLKTFEAYEEDYDGDHDEYHDDYGVPGEFGGFEGLEGLEGLEGFDELDGYDEFGEFRDSGDLNDLFENLLGSLEGRLSDILVKKGGEEDPEPGFILHKTGDDGIDSDTGRTNKASKADAAASMAIDDMMKQNAIQLRTYQITSQILDHLSELCDKGRIFCQCGDFDGKIILAGNAVHIECKDCGSYRDIRSVNASDAEYLSGMDELYLDFDD